MVGYRGTGGSRRGIGGSRRGFTMIEALVGLGVVVVLALIAIPVVYRVMERFRAKACEANLRRIGAAFEVYRSNFQDRFPIGSQYQRSPESPYGKSWWNDVLRYSENDQLQQVDKNWANIASSGYFNGKTGNQNIKLVDGLRPDIMFCPSSSLPHGNNPKAAISPATQKLLGHEAQGIPVPMYVAISGSAPDMQGANLGTPITGPHGRNTRDGKYGILSGSGVFPPNQQVSAAMIRDGSSHTIAVAEQSVGWDWEDESFEKPVPFDFRSAWPDGGFTGSGGNYQTLSPTAEGVDGSGDQRCLNCTTVRYGVNKLGFLKGIVAYPAGPIVVKEDHKAPPAPKVLGPGHNQGIFSAHGGGAWVLFADGSVHWLDDGIALNVLQALCTRDDGIQTEGY